MITLCEKAPIASGRQSEGFQHQSEINVKTFLDRLTLIYATMIATASLLQFVFPSENFLAEVQLYS